MSQRQFHHRRRLQPSSAGARVALKNGKISMTDGPFVETKEIVGGYAIMDAKSREEARALARRFMELHLKHWTTFDGECEVRPRPARRRLTGVEHQPVVAVHFFTSEVATGEPVVETEIRRDARRLRPRHCVQIE
jgi:hypothetical protein